jgi:hypothetical protein
MSAVSLNGTSVRAFKAEEASLALSVATYKGELEHLARGPKNLHEHMERPKPLRPRPTSNIKYTLITSLRAKNTPKPLCP